MSAPQSTPARNWRELYEEALLEFDPVKLLERIADAEKAIAAECIVLMRSGGDGIERQVLTDAMQTLEDLKRHTEEAAKLRRNRFPCTAPNDLASTRSQF